MDKHTGKTEKQVEKDADRDHWLSAKEAADYGLVDHVLENKNDLPDDKKEKG